MQRVERAGGGAFAAFAPSNCVFTRSPNKGLQVCRNQGAAKSGVRRHSAWRSPDRNTTSKKLGRFLGWMTSRKNQYPRYAASPSVIEPRQNPSRRSGGRTRWATSFPPHTAPPAGLARFVHLSPLVCPAKTLRAGPASHNRTPARRRLDL